MNGTGLPAASSLRLGNAGGIAHDGVGRRAVGGYFFGLEFVGVSVARGGIELPARRSCRMGRAIAERHHGEDQQRRDLDDVDGDVDGGRAVDAAMGDLGDARTKTQPRPAIMNIGPGLVALMKLGHSVPTR